MNELGVDMLRSIGMAMRILGDFLKSEDLDKPSTLAQIMQFLNISVEFKELAMDISKPHDHALGPGELCVLNTQVMENSEA